MPVTDKISDYITRIRNAGKANHKVVEIPHSKLKYAISEILKEQGFIDDCEKIDDGVQGKIIITLRYHNRLPAIREIKRISTPGRRVYSSVSELPRIKNGLGIAIISTSRGVMTDKHARKNKLGGEVLFSVW